MITTVRNYFSSYEDPAVPFHKNNHQGRKSVQGRPSVKLDLNAAEVYQSLNIIQKK
jgi:hypothetical protein